MVGNVTSPAASSRPPARSNMLSAVKGARLAAGNCGIRYKDRSDLLLMEFAAGTTVAGVFTKSLTAAAPVEACRASLKKGKARALVVNAGNSNAFTGKAGVASVKRVSAAACKLAGCKSTDFFMASTGVIGQKLPDEKITGALPGLFRALSEDAWEDAARAIMTTDTYSKMTTRSATISGTRVTL